GGSGLIDYPPVFILQSTLFQFLSQVLPYALIPDEVTDEEAHSIPTFEQANHKTGQASKVIAVDCLIVPGTTEPIVIIHQTNADHSSLAARIVIDGRDGSWQTEREVGIYGVILHVETDSLEVILGRGIAVGTVICQC